MPADPTPERLDELARRCEAQAKLLLGHLPTITRRRPLFSLGQDAHYMAAYSVSATIGLLEECTAALRARAKEANDGNE